MKMTSIGITAAYIGSAETNTADPHTPNCQNPSVWSSMPSDEKTAISGAG
jgi:hypothetical protein